MSTQTNGVIRYNPSDPADLAVIVENGLVWKAGEAAQQAAFDALVSGALPMNDRIPADILSAIESARAAGGTA